MSPRAAGPLLAALRAAARFVSWALTAVLVSACQGPQASPEGMLLSGCKALLPSGVCVSPEGEVTVWLPVGAAAALSGGDVRARVEVEGGTRTTLWIADGGRLAVGAYGLDVVHESPGEAECPAEGAPPLDGGPLGLCLATRASRLWQGGDLDASLALHQEAIAALDAAGWEREARLERLRVAFAEVEVGLPARVIEVPEDADLVVRYMQAYANGLRASLVGDHGAAMRWYADAVSLARRGDSPRRVVNTQERWVELLLRLGRTDEALARMNEPAEAAGGGPCWSADRALGRAWALMEVRDAVAGSGVVSVDPWPDLLAARVDDPACSGRGRAADLAVDVARAHLQDGDARRALQALDGLDLTAAPADTVRWRWELEGRARLLVGEPAAAEVGFSRALDVSAEDLEGRWSAWVGLARARAALGDVNGALTRWDEALQIQDVHAAMIPLRMGRSTFVDQRTAAAAEHAALLVSTGRLAEAFDAARRWRAVVLRTLAAGERAGGLDDTGMAAWTDVVDTYTRARRVRAKLEALRASAPADELAGLDARLADAWRREQEALDTGAVLIGIEPAAPRDPAPDEVLVTWLREGTGLETRWRGLVRDAAGVRSVDAVASSDPSALMAPLAPYLRRARRVTLLAPSALEGLDLHLTTLDGEPLVTAREVVWSVDLGPASRQGGQGEALVVADPGGGLGNARAEGEAVVRLLMAGGAPVRRLGPGTTDQTLLTSLGDGPWLLHYAGHGEARGGGLSSRLVLADGTSLNIADVLTLPVAPMLVVLAGCETGRTLPLGVAEIGLAHAFVAAGSEAVVATVRPVADGLAAAFSVAFHEADPRRRGAAAAFRSAVDVVRRERPSEDWAAFRLVVR